MSADGSNLKRGITAILCITVVCVLVLSGMALLSAEDVKADQLRQQQQVEAQQKVRQNLPSFDITESVSNVPDFATLKPISNVFDKFDEASKNQPSRQSAAAFLDSPATNFIPPTPQSKLLTDADIGIEPQKNANSTPAGAWASTLVPVATESNLFRDPATGKLVQLRNGQLFAETDPYAGIALAAPSFIPDDLSPSYRISDKLDDGNIIRLNNGSLWQISPLDKIHTTLWRQFSGIKVIVGDNALYPYKLLNEDNDEVVDAKQVARVNFVTETPTWDVTTPISHPLPTPAYQFSPPTSPGISASMYEPNSLANPYGAGSPYKADGLMNPYSQYGSPYSSKSWRNPYATDTPKLYDSQGNYRGKLSSNPYDPDSTANPYGRYGSRYSPESINNPYGAGNPYNTTPIYAVPSP